MAFTLTECLVVMIVGGIIFLGVMEGLGLVTAHVAGKGAAMNREQQAYSDLQTLSGILSVCDSIGFSDEKIIVWKTRRQTTLFSGESILILERENFMDTLFMGCQSVLNVTANTEDVKELPAISLKVDFGGEYKIDHNFYPRLSAKQLLTSTINEAEEEYLYD